MIFVGCCRWIAKQYQIETRANTRIRKPAGVNCLSSGTSRSRTTPVRRWPFRDICSSYLQLRDDGDCEQLRVRPETVHLVVLTLCLAQGLQVRGRFFKEFSTDTSPKGETANECLFGVPHNGTFYPKDAGYSGLHPFSVYPAVSHTFSRS